MNSCFPQSRVSQANKKNIMANTLKIEQSANYTKRNNRNMLNKWFQDSVKNYIMEVYAAPFLIGEYSLGSLKEVKDFILSRVDKSICKYMGILKAYYEAILECNKLQKFCRRLANIIEGFRFLDNCDLICRERRKQYISLLVLTYFESKGFCEINSFQDLWKICFDEGDDQLKSKKDNTEETCINPRTQSQSLISNISIDRKLSEQTNKQEEQAAEICEYSEILQPTDEDFVRSEPQIQDEVLLFNRTQYNDYSSFEASPITPSDLFSGRLDQSIIPDSYSIYVGELNWYLDQNTQTTISYIDYSYSSQDYYQNSVQPSDMQSLRTFTPFSAGQIHEHTIPDPFPLNLSYF